MGGSWLGTRLSSSQVFVGAEMSPVPTDLNHQESSTCSLEPLRYSRGTKASLISFNMGGTKLWVVPAVTRAQPPCGMRCRQQKQLRCPTSELLTCQFTLFLVQTGQSSLLTALLSALLPPPTLRGGVCNPAIAAQGNASV